MTETTARTPRRARTFTLLWFCYTASMLGGGFLGFALPAILRESGAPLTVIGILAGLTGLYSAKVFWAPLVDRYRITRSGHYGGWLLLLQPAIAVALAVLAPADVVGDTGLVVAVFAIVMVLSATQDVATDALAVTVLRPADRGLGNGIQNAGGYLGTLIGGGGALLVYNWAGWAAAMLTLAAVTLVPVLVLWRYPEPPRPAERPSLPATYLAMWTLVRQPRVARWALVTLPLLLAGMMGAFYLSTPALVDAGWSLDQVAVLSAVLYSVTGIPAAVLSGWAVTCWGTRRVIQFALGLGVITVAGLFPLAGGVAPVVTTSVVLCLFNVANVSMATVMYTIAMGLSRPATAATDYTLLSSLSILVASTVGAVLVAAAETTGYAPMFALVILLFLASLAVSTWWRGAVPEVLSDTASEPVPAGEPR